MMTPLLDVRALRRLAASGSIWVVELARHRYRVYFEDKDKCLDVNMEHQDLVKKDLNRKRTRAKRKEDKS